jgi:hypothetical protein
MTKKEVLESKFIGHNNTWKKSTIDRIEEAMDEYAKQRAIAFALHVLGKLKRDRVTWVAQENDDYIMAVCATADNHYDKFIASQTQTTNTDTKNQ